MTGDEPRSGPSASADGASAGRDINVTTIYRIFREAPNSISSQIRSAEFETLVQERTRNFVGRDFVFRAIDGHLNEPTFRSGYIVVHGEPGIGKTSIIAELIRRHCYVHHFNIAAQNIRSAGDFLSNVCAQLIARYDLEQTALPPGSADNSGYFSRLLSEARDKSTGKPIVVLVDALDEAEISGVEGANVLYLPVALPQGVFIVATIRRLHDVRLHVDTQHDIYIDDDDPANLADVHTYIEEFIESNKEALESPLAHWGVSSPEFADLITSKSEGNFMYVVHVLHDIRSGKLGRDAIDDVRALPAGLRGYYKRHWRTMTAQNGELFERLYQPVVCTLAVVREPVTRMQLRDWASRLAGTSLSQSQIGKVLGDWRQFLNEDVGDEGEPTYRIYHTSFQDFLRDEIGLAAYHENIADAALAKLQESSDAPKRP